MLGFLWISYEQFGLHNTPHLLQHELAVSGDSVFLDMIAATRTNAVRSSLLQPQLLATSSAMSHCPKQEQNEQSAQNEKLKHKDSKDFQSTSAGTAKARPPLLSSTAAGEASLTHRSGKEFGDVDSRESTRTLYTYMYQTWYIYIRIYNIISHTHVIQSGFKTGASKGTSQRSAVCYLRWDLSRNRPKAGPVTRCRISRAWRMSVSKLRVFFQQRGQKKLWHLDLGSRCGLRLGMDIRPAPIATKWCQYDFSILFPMMASLIDALHIAITIYHLSVGILNFSNQLLESGFLCTHKSIHEWDSLAKSCKIHENGPRGITPRDAQKHPKPQTYRMLLNPWPSMTIPWCEWRKIRCAQSATKQKRRTVQHLRKISCRLTSPRPRAWIQIANPKSCETSDIDCDYSHVHSSQLLFLSSIFPIGFFQI